MNATLSTVRTAEINGHKFSNAIISSATQTLTCTTCKVVLVKRASASRAREAMQAHINGRSIPKVATDGTVTLDGEVIGSVVKVVDSLSIYRAISEDQTPTVWQPRYIDGTPVIENVRTRKEAVAILVKATRPMSVDGMRRERGWTGREFISASVTVKGTHFGVSQYSDENVWVVDSLMPLGAIMPHFVNGSGTRVTRADVITDATVIAALDAARDAFLSQN